MNTEIFIDGNGPLTDSIDGVNVLQSLLDTYDPFNKFTVVIDGNATKQIEADLQKLIKFVEDSDPDLEMYEVLEAYYKSSFADTSKANFSLMNVNPAKTDPLVKYKKTSLVHKELNLKVDSAHEYLRSVIQKDNSMLSIAKDDLAYKLIMLMSTLDTNSQIRRAQALHHEKKPLLPASKETFTKNEVSQIESYLAEKRVSLPHFLLLHYLFCTFGKTLKETYNLNLGLIKQAVRGHAVSVAVKYKKHETSLLTLSHLNSHDEDTYEKGLSNPNKWDSSPRLILLKGLGPDLVDHINREMTNICPDWENLDDGMTLGKFLTDVSRFKETAGSFKYTSNRINLAIKAAIGDKRKGRSSKSVKTYSYTWRFRYLVLNIYGPVEQFIADSTVDLTVPYLSLINDDKVV